MRSTSSEFMFARGMILTGITLALAGLLDQARCWAGPDYCFYSQACTTNGYNEPGYWCDVNSPVFLGSAGTGTPGTKKYQPVGGLCGDERISGGFVPTGYGCGDVAVALSSPPC